MRLRDFGVSQRRMSAVSISDAASPAPSRRHSMRNGRSVTPAIGASTMLEGSTCVPILMVILALRRRILSGKQSLPWLGRTRLGRTRLRRSICSARDLLFDVAQAHVDLEPFGVFPRIDDVERRVSPLSGREHASDGLAHVLRGLE